MNKGHTANDEINCKRRVSNGMCFVFRKQVKLRHLTTLLINLIHNLTTRGLRKGSQMTQSIEQSSDFR